MITERESLIALRSRAEELRHQGLGYTRISKALGVPRSTIIRWVNPRSAEVMRQGSRAAKERNRGTCVSCGRSTNACKGPGKAARLCAVCNARAVAESRRGSGPVVSEVLGLLADGPIRYSEIRDRLGLTSAHAANALNRLVAYGLVHRVSRGIYSLAGEGE